MVKWQIGYNFGLVIEDGDYWWRCGVLTGGLLPVVYCKDQSWFITCVNDLDEDVDGLIRDFGNDKKLVELWKVTVRKVVKECSRIWADKRQMEFIWTCAR